MVLFECSDSVCQREDFNVYCNNTFTLTYQSINQSIIYLNQAKAHKTDWTDRVGLSSMKNTKLEKNSSKLVLQ